MNDEFEQDFFDDEQFTEMMHTLSMVYREMPYGRPDPLRWGRFVDAAEKLGRIAEKNGSRLNVINVNLKISSQMISFDFKRLYLSNDDVRVLRELAGRACNFGICDGTRDDDTLQMFFTFPDVIAFEEDDM